MRKNCSQKIPFFLNEYKFDVFPNCFLVFLIYVDAILTMLLFLPSLDHLIPKNKYLWNNQRKRKYKKIVRKLSICPCKTITFFNKFDSSANNALIPQNR